MDKIKDILVARSQTTPPKSLDSPAKISYAQSRYIFTQPIKSDRQMKYIKPIIILLILLTPLPTQADQSTLINKLNGSSYDNDHTFVIDFTNDMLHMIFGARYLNLPLDNQKPIANVLFCDTPNGAPVSFRYMDSGMISYTLDNEEPLTLFRWHYTSELREKLQGAWYNHVGTIIFDFKTNEKTSIIDSKIMTLKMSKIEIMANLLIYKLGISRV